MKKLITIATTGLVLIAMNFWTGCQKDDAGAQAGAESASAKPYPLEVCLVSGEPLGSMGDPVVLVHEGQEIKLCCKDCIKEFESDPAKFLTKLKPGGQVETQP